MGRSITEPKEEIMKTLHAAFLSQRSPQSMQALRTRMLILPLAASIYCMGLAADLRAQPVQYIEQGQAYGQGQAQAAFTQQELDQMLAPIALYPDSLLSQILMASTYPLEVVQAARWSRAHPGLSGDDAVRAVASQDWDPSVKSMLAFPQILSMMDERLDWTQRLGDAFLDQEPHVMETVQTLRQRAYAAGNLISDAQVRVVRQDRIILVEPLNPQVVYVPYYDPTVIYGSWWWPAPPVYWRPWAGYAPVHVRPGLSVGFYWGSGVRISVGFFFGRPDWQRRHVNVVHVNNYYHHHTVVNRDGRRDGRGDARPDRGTGPRSDAAPQASPPAQRLDQAQAQQRRQAEESQRQQQTQQRLAEQVQRHQQAERVQREQQQRQAEQVQRQQQRQAEQAQRQQQQQAEQSLRQQQQAQRQAEQAQRQQQQAQQRYPRRQCRLV